MNVIFMGTPEFAVPCLKRLIDDGHTVSAVFTQPDKPKGRGYKMVMPPVKELAVKYDIPVYQPNKLKNNEEAFGIIESIDADLIVVVAYGKLLPARILKAPKLGCINIHASLLPQYRGAGPIQWSVIDGQKITGVTSMFMEEGLDTGDMILKMQTEIGGDETSGELHDRLSEIGAECLSRTLNLFENGNVERIKQDDSCSTYAPMLQKSMGKIDFSWEAERLHNLIRGMSPWPGAYTYIDGKLLKVHKARICVGKSGKPGEILDDKRFIVGCDGGALEFLEVQLEGAKRMGAEDFLRGKKLDKGFILG